MCPDTENFEESEQYKEFARRLDPEYRQQKIEEPRQAKQKLVRYKQLIANGELQWSPEWEDDMTLIPFSALRTMRDPGFTERVINEFCVVWMDLNKVIHKLAHHPDHVYPPDNLWWDGGRTDQYIVDLIDLVHQNVKLVPPILEVNEHIWGV